MRPITSSNNITWHIVQGSLHETNKKGENYFKVLHYPIQTIHTIPSSVLLQKYFNPTIENCDRKEVECTRNSTSFQTIWLNIRHFKIAFTSRLFKPCM